MDEKKLFATLERILENQKVLDTRMSLLETNANRVSDSIESPTTGGNILHIEGFYTVVSRVKSSVHIIIHSGYTGVYMRRQKNGDQLVCVTPVTLESRFVPSDIVNGMVLTKDWKVGIAWNNDLRKKYDNQFQEGRKYSFAYNFDLSTVGENTLDPDKFTLTPDTSPTPDIAPTELAVYREWYSSVLAGVKLGRKDKSGWSKESKYAYAYIARHAEGMKHNKAYDDGGCKCSVDEDCIAVKKYGMTNLRKAM